MIENSGQRQRRLNLRDLRNWNLVWIIPSLPLIYGTIYEAIVGVYRHYSDYILKGALD